MVNSNESSKCTDTGKLSRQAIESKKKGRAEAASRDSKRAIERKRRVKDIAV